MARYIDADILTEEIKSLKISLSGKDIFQDRAKESVLRIIDEQPTADVVEVKHGKWIYKKTYYEADECNCSLCGQLLTTAVGRRMNFCPRCGADMRGKTK